MWATIFRFWVGVQLRETGSDGVFGTDLMLESSLELEWPQRCKDPRLTLPPFLSTAYLTHGTAPVNSAGIREVLRCGVTACQCLLHPRADV